MKKTIKIEGMMCDHCAAAVEKALSGVESTKSVKVNLKKKTASVETDAGNEALIKAIEDAGYSVTAVD